MKEQGMDTKVKLSMLWLFALLNYIYCDVLSLMDPQTLSELMTGVVGGMEMTPNFLLWAAMLMEIPIAMVVLSRVLGYRTNRIANIAAGAVMTLVQVMSLLVGTASVYYLFFSAIEISTTLLIVWLALKWKK